MNDKIPLLGNRQSANIFSTWTQGWVSYFKQTFIFVLFCLFLFLILPGDRGASGLGQICLLLASLSLLN